MKINLTKAYLILAAAILIPTALRAQNGTITPYSRYGYGIISDNATSTQKSMGSVGYAMNSGRQINVMNPASYASIDSLTFLFDMGVTMNTMWTTEGNHSEHTFGGGLDYITMQVPIGKYMGASVGILPFSSVGYSFGDNIDNGKATRQGSGSLNQLYLGLAARPFNGFNVGFNVAYLFGSTLNDQYSVSTNGYQSVFQRHIKVRDWRCDIGLQYSLNLNASNRITLGAVYSPRKELHGDTYGVYWNASVGNGTVKPDTVGYTKLNGKYSLPEKWGAGINYQHGTRWMAEADFTYEPWKKAKFAALEDFEQTNFDNRWKVGVGLQCVPDQRRGYGYRINYRLGAYYTHDYLMIRNNNVREYGITCGLGFPVPSFKTTVNLGLEWKHRQAHPNPLLKENHFNITLGINFNEMWFRKSKIY